MDSELDLRKFGFSAGEKVALADDDWGLIGHDIIIVNVEPVPGSTQCLIRDGEELRTVSRSDLRPLQV
jgi:hypothetical protein